MAAWQRCGDRWLVALGEVGGPAVRILGAVALPGKPGSSDLPHAVRAAKGAGTILVVGSRDSMFRTVDLPAAGQDEMEAMLGLRLEAELPYAPGEAAWGWQRGPGTAGNEAVVIAVRASDVAQDERQLDSAGYSCEAVEAREAALAQLAACLGGAAVTAVVSVAPDAVAVAVTREGSVIYSRVLASAPGGGETAPAKVATEVEQTLDHCAHERGLGGVEAVFIVGEPGLAGALRDDLRATSALPVRDVVGWPGLEVAPAAGTAPDVVCTHAACIGALSAEHERRQGHDGAAPLLRGGKPKLRVHAAAVLARLVVLNVLLLAALVASAFAVRSARLRAVTKALDDARPLLAELAPLEEEVRILQGERAALAPKLDLVLAIVRALPQGLEVSELRIDRKGHVTIRGSTPSVEAVSKAVAALEESKEFTEPRFGRVEPAKQGKTFQIDCTVRQ